MRLLFSLLAVLLVLLPALAFADPRPEADAFQLQPGVLLGGGGEVVDDTPTRFLLGAGGTLLLDGLYVGSTVFALNNDMHFESAVALFLLSTVVEATICHAISENVGLHASPQKRLLTSAAWGLGLGLVGMLVGRAVGSAHDSQCFSQSSCLATEFDSLVGALAGAGLGINVGVATVGERSY